MSDCILWAGTINNSGYGTTTYLGKKEMAHRVVYLIKKGPIPEGFEVAHKCHVRLCINEDHLVLKTHKENCAERKLVKRKLRTHCKRGHSLVEPNIYYNPTNGQRQCAICRHMMCRSKLPNGL